MLFWIHSKLSKRQKQVAVDIFLVFFFFANFKQIKVIVLVRFANSEHFFIILVFFLQMTFGAIFAGFGIIACFYF